MRLLPRDQNIYLAAGSDTQLIRVAADKFISVRHQIFIVRSLPWDSWIIWLQAVTLNSYERCIELSYERRQTNLCVTLSNQLSYPILSWPADSLAADKFISMRHQIFIVRSLEWVTWLRRELAADSLAADRFISVRHQIFIVRSLEWVCHTASRQLDNLCASYYLSVRRGVNSHTLPYKFAWEIFNYVSCLECKNILACEAWRGFTVDSHKFPFSVAWDLSLCVNCLETKNIWCQVCDTLNSYEWLHINSYGRLSDTHINSYEWCDIIQPTARVELATFCIIITDAITVMLRRYTYLIIITRMCIIYNIHIIYEWTIFTQIRPKVWVRSVTLIWQTLHIWNWFGWGCREDSTQSQTILSVVQSTPRIG